MNHPILTAHYRRIGKLGGSSRSPRKLAALARSRAKLAEKRAIVALAQSPLMRCGMCKHVYTGEPGSHCPACGSDETERTVAKRKAEQTTTTAPIQP